MAGCQTLTNNMASNPPIVAQFEAVLESEHPWTCKDIGSNSISVLEILAIF